MLWWCLDIPAVLRSEPAIADCLSNMFMSHPDSLSVLQRPFQATHLLHCCLHRQTPPAMLLHFPPYPSEASFHLFLTQQ